MSNCRFLFAFKVVFFAFGLYFIEFVKETWYTENKRGGD